ncbi:MAG: MATE family efflux transporter, partial [Raoultibacter sp.]
MLKEYLKYIVPTMLTFTLASIYSIVDGVFVGHAVGDTGLAGINVAFPLFALVTAVGTGIGMGGGVIASIAKGADNHEKTRRAMGTTFIMLLVASVPIMAALLLFADPLLTALGGRGDTLEQAKSYIAVIAWGVPFQIFVTGCTPLIRNQGRVAYAMAVQVLAGCMNVLLDYVFVMVLGRGTAGAAEATVISQIAAFVLIAVFFLAKRNRIKAKYLRIDGSIAAHVLRLGMAPFGLSLLPEATVVAINVNLANYGGETALAAYAVISYTACVIQMLIQGVGDGSQPLISRYYGAGDSDAVRRFRNTNYLITVGLGALGLV